MTPSTLPDNVAELAMITTARELDCQFIWHAHAAAGRRAGLNNALVDALRDKQELPPLSSAESAVINYGREFSAPVGCLRQPLTLRWLSLGREDWWN